jgi:hypothetical protein
MDIIKVGSIIFLVTVAVLLGACSSPSPTRPREVTPEAVDSRPVFPTSVAMSPAQPSEATIEVVDSRPVLPENVAILPPPTLVPAPIPVPPVVTPPLAPDEIQPGTPAPVASAAIGATNGAGANLRTGPSMQAPVITTLAEGTPVEALDEPVSAEGRSWQKIRSGDREGWVVAVVVQSR